MMPAYAERPYRAGVGMMLLNTEGQVFVGKRIDQRAEAWQMPQGGIDEGEDPRAAAVRELVEEVGTDKFEIIAESSAWLHYDLPEAVADKVWKGRYRGQKQKWYLCRFLGTNTDIRVTEVEHPEFDAWKWLPMAELLNAIVPFKRDIYARLVDEFAHLADHA